MSISTSRLFGFDLISAESVAEIAPAIVEETLHSTQPEFLITPNAYQTVVLLDRDNSDLGAFYSRSRYVLPDGMPLVWLSKLKGRPLKKRLTGSDLFPEIWREVKRRDIPVTLVLPSEELAEKFKAEYPLCACIVPKFFSADDKEYIRQLAEMVSETVISNNSRFVFIGLGIPKQELLGMEAYERILEKKYGKGLLFLLLGASFEFYFGAKKRAPAFFRRTGLEWLYRFAQEPRRLWKRYTVDNARFIALAIRELMTPKK